MKAYLVFALALLPLAPSPAFAFGKKPVSVPDPVPAPPPPTPVPPPPPGPGPEPEASCPAPGAYQAVDLSAPVDQKFLDVMRQLRVNTVIRYYDQTNETIRGKTLKPAEVDLLARNGFDVLVVFQHNNNQLASFTAARGTSDATRSLALAAANGQAKGSAIYFGVDGGWTAAKDLAAIQGYFAKASPLVRAGGFKVGAYGSGLVCSKLLGSGLVDFCWLSNAKGWPQYQAFLATNQWTMVQHLPQDCGGKNVDFNVVNADLRDLGAFRP
jgi:hypothetical protein